MGKHERHAYFGGVNISKNSNLKYYEGERNVTLAF
jgi:hypothetical protein